MAIPLEELYKSIDNKVTSVYVIPRIRISSIYNPYLSLLYKNFLSSHSQKAIQVLSPHPIVPSFLFKRLFGEHSIIHYHWVQFRDFRELIILLWKFFCITLYRIFGGKIIWTIHNKHHHTRKYLYINTILRKYIARLAVKLIVHYDDAVDIMAPILGVSTNKFAVVNHPSYEVSIIDKNSAQAYVKQNLIHELDTAKPVFLMFGNIAAYKGILECASLFPEATGQLIIAGEVKKGDEQYLQKIEDICGKRHDIFLIPRFISEDEQTNLFNASDCVLFNFQEVLTSGSVILAHNYNKVVIVPDISCCRVIAGDNVLRFKSLEELEQLIIKTAKNLEKKLT